MGCTLAFICRPHLYAGKNYLRNMQIELLLQIICLDIGSTEHLLYTNARKKDRKRLGDKIVARGYTLMLPSDTYLVSQISLYSVDEAENGGHHCFISQPVVPEITLFIIALP